ncbi:MAG: LPS assembly lipoprotein LptE [Phenylobacterium sp.]
MRKLLPLAPALLLLAGCGFTPLYGDTGVVGKLAGVEVHAPEGRPGYLIREHLDDALAAQNGGQPVYRMDLAVSETRYPRGIRIDNVATRYEYVLVAEYTLRALPSNATLKNGRTRVTLTYDSADQPYASITAQQDAQDRAAREAAQRIQLELAAWFAEHRG